METKKKVRFWDYTFFGILLLVYTAVTFYLFYQQVYGNPGYYHSDMKAYILNMQGLDSGYSFPYPLFFKLGAFFHLFLAPETAMAVALTILNSSGLVVLKYYMNRWFQEEKGLLSYLLISVLTLTLFFVSMLYSVTGRSLPGITGRYIGVFSPNPHHNATYMATRTFAIACFFQFGELLKNYEAPLFWKSKGGWLKGICFSLCLFLTTITKPSYTFVLVATAGIIMVFRLIKSRLKEWKPFLFLGISFIPTFCALLYQFVGVFGPVEEGETGIGLGWLTAWSHHCKNVPLAIVLALAFPIGIYIMHYKEIKTEGFFRLSLQQLIMSLAMVILLYEKGFRLPDMNFSWGYMHGMFFSFVACAMILLRSTLKSGKKWYILTAEWLVYFWHLGCGLLYFKNILSGFHYY